MGIKLGAEMGMHEPEDVPVIHCDNCRKQTGSGELGNHWICEDCRLMEQEPNGEARLQQSANGPTEKAHEVSHLQQPAGGALTEQQPHTAYAEKSQIARP